MSDGVRRTKAVIARTFGLSVVCAKREADTKSSNSQPRFRMAANTSTLAKWADDPVLTSRNGKIIRVGHRSHAKHSRQPRQVRKEATATSSCLCSGVAGARLLYLPFSTHNLSPSP